MTRIILTPTRGGGRFTMVVMDTRPTTSLNTRVLIVAPSNEEGQRLERCLTSAEGFEAVTINYAEAARAEIRYLGPQLILLAIAEGEPGGFLTLRHLRDTHDLPIVICSTTDGEEDVLRAFESGASEYLALPLGPAELAARLHAVLRRSGSWPVAQPEKKVLTLGQLEIHLTERRVFRNGKPVDLTPIEFRLFLALARRPGQLVSHEELLTEVWGPQYTDCPHYVRLYMRYLRLKIEEDPHVPRSLISEWGMGYRFEPRGRAPSSRPAPGGRARDAGKRREGASKRQGVGNWLSPAGHTASP